MEAATHSITPGSPGAEQKTHSPCEGHADGPACGMNQLDRSESPWRGIGAVVDVSLAPICEQQRLAWRQTPWKHALQWCLFLC